MGGLILAGPLGRFAHAVIYRSATILMPMLKKIFYGVGTIWPRLAQRSPSWAKKKKKREGSIG